MTGFNNNETLRRFLVDTDIHTECVIIFRMTGPIKVSNDIYCSDGSVDLADVAAGKHTVVFADYAKSVVDIVASMSIDLEIGDSVNVIEVDSDGEGKIEYKRLKLGLTEEVV
jgi:predicted RNA methylase